MTHPPAGAAPAPEAPGHTPPPPMAGGTPIGEAVADAAAEWLTLLMSGEATDADRQRWQAWRSAHPDHERAWRHVEAVTGRFRLMAPQAAYQALSPYAGLPSPARRRALSPLLWGGAIGVTGALATRSRAWQAQMADYRTGTGEQRNVALDDGTHILLNTASAIDVRFNQRRRLVRLVEGEAMIVTGHAAADARPFLVETGEGRIRALGTRFTVRQGSASTTVAVLQSAVEITPGGASGLRQVLRAGESASFTRHAIAAALPARAQDAAWTRGQIVADNMRLGDFLADLARYRPGILRCDPAAADLRFSGVFPLQDTDRILGTLPSVLPVQVRLRTRYWATVEVRP